MAARVERGRGGVINGSVSSKIDDFATFLTSGDFFDEFKSKSSQTTRIFFLVGPIPVDLTKKKRESGDLNFDLIRLRRP